MSRALPVIVALVATVAFGGTAHAATARPHKPCVYEDSSWCVWDAVHMGNGGGRSYWSDRHGRTHYVSHRTAHRLLR